MHLFYPFSGKLVGVRYVVAHGGLTLNPSGGGNVGVSIEAIMYFPSVTTGVPPVKTLPTELDRLITLIAQSLVDQPDHVRIRTHNSSHTMVVELHVAKDDVGKVIGKKGRTVNAMRTLVGAAASKINKHTVLEVVE